MRVASNNNIAAVDVAVAQGSLGFTLVGLHNERGKTGGDGSKSSSSPGCTQQGPIVCDGTVRVEVVVVLEHKLLLVASIDALGSN